MPNHTTKKDLFMVRRQEKPARIAYYHQENPMLEIIAIISIVSVLLWFLIGANKSVNINNYTEEELKDKE